MKLTTYILALLSVWGTHSMLKLVKQAFAVKTTKHDEDLLPQGEKFKQLFESTGPAEIDEVCRGEREAVQTSKERAKGRKRKLVRSEAWNGRFDPRVLSIFLRFAEKAGGTSIADGMHISAELLADREGFEEVSLELATQSRIQTKLRQSEKLARTKNKKRKALSKT